MPPRQVPIRSQTALLVLPLSWPSCLVRPSHLPERRPNATAPGFLGNHSRPASATCSVACPDATLPVFQPAVE